MTTALIAGTAQTAPPPPGRSGGSGRRAALVAGSSLVLMAGLAGFAMVGVVEGLTTPGDPARTAADISASDGLFRAGLLSLYAVVVLDVLVAWALFRVFSPVSSSLSRLAAWLRLSYSVVFLVAIAELAAVPRLLDGDGFAGPLTDADRQAQAGLAIDSFHDIWMAGLVLFGAHLVVIGLLAHRSGYVPRLLGVLVAIAGAGYLIDSVAFFVVPDAPAVSAVTFAGELLLGVWLLARARRIPEEQS